MKSEEPTTSSINLIVRESDEGLTRRTNEALWILSYSPTTRNAGSQFQSAATRRARSISSFFGLGTLER